jgi:hypothetical protein
MTPLAEQVHKHLVARHSRSKKHATDADPVSLEYPELTTTGVGHARAVGQCYVVPLLLRQAPGTILVMGGVTDGPRTTHTKNVHVDVMRSFERSHAGIAVLDAAAYATQDLLNEAIERTLHDQSEARIVLNTDDDPEGARHIDANEFRLDYTGRWTKPEGYAYFNKLRADLKAEGTEPTIGAEWVKQDGVYVRGDETLNGPKPQKVADECLAGLETVHYAAKAMMPNSIGNEQLIVLTVGHQADLDVLVTQLAAGEVTPETHNRVTGGERVIQESEMFYAELRPTNTKVTYRQATFERQHEVGQP